MSQEKVKIELKKDQAETIFWVAYYAIHNMKEDLNEFLKNANYKVLHDAIDSFDQQLD